MKLKTSISYQTGEAKCVSVPPSQCSKKNVLSCEHACRNTHKHTLKHTHTHKHKSFRCPFLESVIRIKQVASKFTGPGWNLLVKLRDRNQTGWMGSAFIWVQLLKPHALNIDPPIITTRLIVEVSKNNLLNNLRKETQSTAPAGRDTGGEGHRKCFSFDLWQRSEGSRGKNTPKCLQKLQRQVRIISCPGSSVIRC